LKLESTALNIDTLLKNLIPIALDQDTFAISAKRTQNSDLEDYLLVDQTQYSPHIIPKSNEVISNMQSRTLTIVDRTANIEAAAKAIITARFSFQGTSPYAPDLVIVNDFAKKKFFEAATRFATQIFAERKVGKEPIELARSMKEETRNTIKETEAKGQASSFGSSDFKIIDISDRFAPRIFECNLDANSHTEHVP
jgi:acyl-CoA reductase-like NAD-dependent aldehyde dehydrogenase